MIMIILLVIFGGVTLASLLINMKKDYESDVFYFLSWIFGAFTLVTLMIAIFFIPTAYSITCTSLQKEKEILELQLQHGTLNQDLLEKVIKYNNDLNYLNSFWWRFNIEDRNALFIDIFSFLGRI